jgi:predicted nucleic acid binding AN1-type Zn finger protein
MYSANRLADLQKQIMMSMKNKKTFDPKVETFIRCSKCVGGSAVEHQCYHCNITFPRTERYFSKNMLKMRKDEAVSIFPLQSNYY